jgi:hypothetical protein
MIEKLPPDHPMVADLKRLEFLTAFATTYRYPKPGGQLPPPPDASKIAAALDQIDALIKLACAISRWMFLLIRRSQLRIQLECEFPRAALEKEVPLADLLDKCAR